MSFKKFLLNKGKECVSGQSVIEYIIIFLVITLIAIEFVPKVQSDVFQPYFNATVNHILR